MKTKKQKGYPTFAFPFPLLQLLSGTIVAVIYRENESTAHSSIRGQFCLSDPPGNESTTTQEHKSKRKSSKSHKSHVNRTGDWILEKSKMQNYRYHFLVCCMIMQIGSVDMTTRKEMVAEAAVFISVRTFTYQCMTHFFLLDLSFTEASLPWESDTADLKETGRHFCPETQIAPWITLI